MERAEVVIVGGGPAGIATALFLQHARPELTERIVVLEKERYPRDKPCAGAIGARGEKALARIGVKVDVDGAPFDHVTVVFGAGTREVHEPGAGRVVRRVEFDHALAREALRRGVRVVDGARVGAVRFERGAALVESGAGAFEARAVVGADGVGSFVRRALGLPVGTWRAQAVEVDTEEVPGDPARDAIRFDLSDHALAGYTWDFPTRVRGAWMVCRGVYRIKLDAREVDLGARLDAHLRARGLAPGASRAKRFAERGFELHRPIARPRALLVGEAAGIDPITGEGIAQALLYGEVAGRYLAARLASGDLAFDDWSRFLRATRLGVDLHVRTSLLPLVFGEARARTARWPHRTPGVLEAGAGLFAGKPARWGKLLAAGAGALRELSAGPP
jgi:flavin-dependent dehydrogenase